MSTTHPPQKEAPSLTVTGLGYRFVRCRYDGDDSTVYLHQLCAIAGGADPHDVFSDHFDTHHCPLEEVFDLDADAPAPPINTDAVTVPPIDAPHTVELRPRNQHRRANLRGASDD